MSHVPGVWVFALLAMAAFRCFVLLSKDVIARPVRAWIVGWDGAEVGRPVLATWLECPWCSGLWWAFGWWVAWLVDERVVVVAVPLALSAVVGVVESVHSTLVAEQEDLAE